MKSVHKQIKKATERLQKTMAYQPLVPAGSIGKAKVKAAEINASVHNPDDKYPDTSRFAPGPNHFCGGRKKNFKR